jgi:putative SOS response-associated peptidase YedK
MCGRVIQSSAAIRYAIVDGLDVRDSRVHRYPPRWNGAPSQDLLVIRRNHKTGEVSLDPLRWDLIPYWCEDPKGGRKPINAKYETVRTLPSFREAYRSRRCILPVDGFFEWKAIKGQKAKQPYAHRHEGRESIRHRRPLGELEGPYFWQVGAHVRHHHNGRQRTGR